MGKDSDLHMSSAHFDTQTNTPADLEDGNLSIVELAPSSMSGSTTPTTRMSRTTKGSRPKADQTLYLQLFQATLHMVNGPIAWEVKDVRLGFAGTIQTWSEPVLYLLCSAKVE